MQSLSGAIWVGLALAGGAAAGPTGTDEKTPPPGAGTPVAVRPLSERTIVEAGRTRVITFGVEEPIEIGAHPKTAVSDPSVLEVARAAAVEAGEPFGYVRVRGLRPGRTTLTIGGAALRIQVVEPGDQTDRERFAPRIVGPVTGAAVWGIVAVGVELRQRPNEPLRHVAVLLPDGVALEPLADTESRHHPFRHLLFKVDTRSFPAGPLELVGVAIDPDGGEQTGDPVRVRVVHPDDCDLTAGEAETRYDVERPERFRDARASVGRHPRASGGKFFLNASAYPAVCFPLAVERPGWYQVMLIAAGSRAKGVLATVGIVIDGANVSTTNGRLLGEDWHRLAAGIPFRLEPGSHILTPFFANDFWVPQLADRNLYLDRIEVARVADAGADAGPGSDRDDRTMGMRAGGMAGRMAGGPASNGDDGDDGDTIIDDPYGVAAVGLRIGFVRPLEGQTLPGTFEIEGRCWWVEDERVPAPMVSLLINGRVIATQRSGAPRFWVDSSHFSGGNNRIQLRATLDSGAVAATPVQTAHYPAAAAEDRLPPRHHRRFSIHDERWDPRIRDLLRGEHHPKERRAAAFFSETSVALNLPPELAGTFKVFLHLRGDHFEGPPVASVSLRAGAEEHPLGDVAAPTWWDTRLAGTAELPFGPKQLIVAFTNDRFEPGKGDRNLWLQAVTLAQEPIEPDRTAPVVEVLYPPGDHRAYLADALVADASDNASLASAELLLDGVPTGMTTNLNLKPGLIVFPLLLRSVEPGKHSVAVRVTDVAGNATLSEPRTILVAATEPREAGTYDRAIHLLNRFAYGPDPDELAAILTQGESAWLAGRLEGSFDDAGDLAALGASFPYFVNRSVYEVPRRAIVHLLLTPNPVRARFVMWAQNHFSTWIRKTQGNRKWDEHIAFSRLGPARFDRLLLASAESPAMLNYLDQDSSFAGRLNENYAREIMELHTLGVDGGYSQADVTSLAGLLTGWTASFEGDGRGGGQPAQRFTFRFAGRLSDGSATRVVGMAFEQAAPKERYDRIRTALEMLAAHPSTARFVSRKLAEHYVSVPAPDDLVDDLATVYLETGGDMAALLIAIAVHPAFWADAARERIAHPLDYAVRLCRTTRHHQPWQVGEYLQRSGAGLFDRPSPDGYPQEDSAYIDSNALVQRWRFARQVLWPLAGLVPGPWRYSDARPEPQWRQLVIDVVAVRLTGRVLGEISNRAALDLLESSTGNRDERVRLLATFIAQLPEGNLR